MSAYEITKLKYKVKALKRHISFLKKTRAKTNAPTLINSLIIKNSELLERVSLALNKKAK